MGIAREADRAGIRQIKLRCYVALRLSPDRPQYVVPFPPRQGTRIVPSGDMRIQAGVGPKVVPMGHKRDPRRLRGK